MGGVGLGLGVTGGDEGESLGAFLRGGVKSRALAVVGGDVGVVGLGLRVTGWVEGESLGVVVGGMGLLRGGVEGGALGLVVGVVGGVSLLTRGALGVVGDVKTLDGEFPSESLL